MHRLSSDVAATPLRVLIVEPSAAGHYMTSYVRLLAAEGRRRGWHMGLMTTPAAVADRAFEPVRDAAGDELEVLLVEGDARAPATMGALIRSQLRWRRTMARAFRASGGAARWDAVYVNNLDRVDKAIGLLGSPFGRTPYSGMLISQRFHHATMGVNSPRTRSDALYTLLFERMLHERSLRALATIDEPLQAFAAARQDPDYRKVRYVPDPAAVGSVGRAEARRAFGLRDDQVVLLVYGSLELRKGVAQLLAAAALPTIPTEVVLLFAGRQDEDVKRLFSEPAPAALLRSGRVILRAGFQDDRAEAEAFAAADIVWLGYVGFYGTSGVMLQSGRVGAPVIGSREGVVGWTVDREQLGMVVDPRDAESVARAIRTLAGDPAARARFGERGRAYAAARTVNAFARALADAIEGRGTDAGGALTGKVDE